MVALEQGGVNASPSFSRCAGAHERSDDTCIDELCELIFAQPCEIAPDVAVVLAKAWRTSGSGRAFSSKARKRCLLEDRSRDWVIDFHKVTAGFEVGVGGYVCC